jgi:hypothetical protein
MTIAVSVATVAVGLFAGASAYVTVVQHPAWVQCGPALSVRHFAASTRRAAILQGGLAVVGLVSSAVAWFLGSGIGWLLGGLLLGAMIPFTLVIIMPTNRRLENPQLDAGSREAAVLLLRWGRLHAVRTAVGIAVFIMFVCMTLR